jgi:hypothetical protein
MTIEELEEKLPHGFHDSYLVGIAVDFLAGTCRIEIDVDHDDPDPDTFRRIRLVLSGLSLLIIEPPNEQGVLAGRDTIWISGSSTSEKMLSNLDSYRQSAPSGSFFYSFSLRDRSSYIHLAATDAKLE